MFHFPILAPPRIILSNFLKSFRFCRFLLKYILHFRNRWGVVSSSSNVYIFLLYFLWKKIQAQSVNYYILNQVACINFSGNKNKYKFHKALIVILLLIVVCIPKTAVKKRIDYSIVTDSFSDEKSSLASRSLCAP